MTLDPLYAAIVGLFTTLSGAVSWFVLALRSGDLVLGSNHREWIASYEERLERLETSNVALRAELKALSADVAHASSEQLNAARELAAMHAADKAAHMAENEQLRAELARFRQALADAPEGGRR